MLQFSIRHPSSSLRRLLCCPGSLAPWLSLAVACASSGWGLALVVDAGDDNHSHRPWSPAWDFAPLGELITGHG